MTVSDFCRTLDHTMLKPEAMPADIDQAVAEAISHSFAALCIAPVWVKEVAEKLDGTAVRVCAVASFPTAHPRRS